VTLNLWSEVFAVQEVVDAWSLWVMAFELLTGKRALNMEQGRKKVRHCSEPYRISHHHMKDIVCGFKLLHSMQMMDRIQGLKGKSCHGKVRASLQPSEGALASSGAP
jgi:hypothetical protein